MRLLSPRLLVPLAFVVIVWGGVQVLTTHTVAVTPAVWPIAASASPSPQAGAAAIPTAPAPSPSPSGGTGAIPLLPGALQHLNGSTRDTATGLYALIQQLEAAVRANLEQLVKQLEPGR
ncbi:MAG: hypothetical protein M3019_09105 [Candidatus Dormibacteraeota bacterium]|nr:hypothetical protein [Candidatus Dormibacteraeota bacterium]